MNYENTFLPAISLETNDIKTIIMCNHRLHLNKIKKFKPHATSNKPITTESTTKYKHAHFRTTKDYKNTLKKKYVTAACKAHATWAKSNSKSFFARIIHFCWGLSSAIYASLLLVDSACTDVLWNQQKRIYIH